MAMEIREPDSKVLFCVECEDGSCDVETLWATSLGDDLYRLDNSPFYAYSVSWEDVVYAQTDPNNGRRTFCSVTEKSGNRTVRIILDPPFSEGNRSAALLQELTDFGCSYEGATPSLVSVNIPPHVELSDCVSKLVGSGYQWEHADPSYNELYPSQAS